MLLSPTLSTTLLLLKSASKATMLSSAVIDECNRTAGLIIVLELRSKYPRLRDVDVGYPGRCSRVSLDDHDETAGAGVAF